VKISDNLEKVKINAEERGGSPIESRANLVEEAGGEGKVGTQCFVSNQL